MVSLPQECGGGWWEWEQRAAEEQKTIPWSEPTLIFQISAQRPAPPSCGLGKEVKEVSQVWGCTLGPGWPCRQSQNWGRIVTTDCGFPRPGARAGCCTRVLPAPGILSDIWLRTNTWKWGWWGLKQDGSRSESTARTQAAKATGEGAVWASRISSPAWRAHSLPDLLWTLSHSVSSRIITVTVAAKV